MIFNGSEADGGRLFGAASTESRLCREIAPHDETEGDPAASSSSAGVFVWNEMLAACECRNEAEVRSSSTRSLHCTGDQEIGRGTSHR